MLALASSSILVCAAEPATAGLAAATSLSTNSPWTRVVAIGASATSGVIGPGATDGTNIAVYRFSRYLDAALLAPHEPVKNLGNLFFFLAPPATAKAQVDRALKANPTTVVALDFLFWFCYGDVVSEQERLSRFESGLKFLEKFECPVVVGDVPDVSAATNQLLRPSQVPATSTLAKANERLRDWAAQRKDFVVVVELARFMEAVSRNEPVQVRQIRVKESKFLLQNDHLHPTARGAAMLALAIADALSTQHRRAGEQPVQWDLDALMRAAAHPK